MDATEAFARMETEIRKLYPHITARECQPDAKDIPVAPFMAPLMVSHVLWMCIRGKEFLRQGETEKAHRWLGFIQGAVWGLGMLTIDDLRKCNKEG